MDGSEASEIYDFSSSEPEQKKLPTPDQVATYPSTWYSNFLSESVSSVPSEDLVTFAGVIADKLPSELNEEKTHEYKNAITALTIGEETVSFFHKLASTQGDVRIEPEIIEVIYKYINHPNRLVRRFAARTISPLIYLDNRNGQDAIGLAEKVEDDIVQKIVNPIDDDDFTTGISLLKHTSVPKSEKASELFFKALDISDNEDAYKRCVASFSIALGLEEVRALMREHAQENTDFKPKFEVIEAELGFVPGKTYDDLKRLYDAINFENYTPNEQLIEHDEQFLLSIIDAKKSDEKSEEPRVLDIGTGPGRHIDRLTRKGINVVGFDFVQKHAEQAKQTNPKAQVMVADWHNTPFKDESFDIAYCLGRSSSHNTRIEDYVGFLEETNRILTGDGALVIDTPDSKSPYYQEQIDRVKAISKELGIPEITLGIIVDSPDGINYFDRLVPSRDQFRAIARIAGFDAVEIESQQYDAQEGAARNIYWKLTRSSEKLSPAKLTEYYRVAYGEGKFITPENLNDQEYRKAS